MGGSLGRLSSDGTPDEGVDSDPDGTGSDELEGRDGLAELKKEVSVRTDVSLRMRIADAEEVVTEPE